jgi:signal transduction histidine kinase
MTPARPAVESDLDRFAGAVAHEIRTPLTALSGEIEVALRRDRSAEDYRAILCRIATAVSELVAISGDLTLLSGRANSGAVADITRIDALLAAIRRRYEGRRDIAIAGDDPIVDVAGDEPRLVRAVTLVIEHATRHRRRDAQLSVRAHSTGRDDFRIAIAASPSGFWPNAWDALSGRGPELPLRLRTAVRILDECGGALLRSPADDAVSIVLRPIS